jgi:hypothetical protein
MDLADLFAQDDAAALLKFRAEQAAEKADPEHDARLRAKFAAEEQRIEREITAGLRDADGEWITTDEEGDDEEEGDEE